MNRRGKGELPNGRKKKFMYGILNDFMTTNQIGMLGILVTFLITFLALRFPLPFLPRDQGRAFAVNGALSRGKTRGVGLLFVICFLIGVVLFVPVDTELIVYGILLVCMMLSGYLDDASDKPWYLCSPKWQVDQQNLQNLVELPNLIQRHQYQCNLAFLILCHLSSHCWANLKSPRQ